MVSDDKKRKSTLELLLGIVKTDGFRALYQGWFVDFFFFFFFFFFLF